MCCPKRNNRQCHCEEPRMARRRSPSNDAKGCNSDREGMKTPRRRSRSCHRPTPSQEHHNLNNSLNVQLCASSPESSTGIHSRSNERCRCYQDFIPDHRRSGAGHGYCERLCNRCLCFTHKPSTSTAIVPSRARRPSFSGMANIFSSGWLYLEERLVMVIPSPSVIAEEIQMRGEERHRHERACVCYCERRVMESCG